jgi:hypothetical protein
VVADARRVRAGTLRTEADAAHDFDLNLDLHSRDAPSSPIVGGDMLETFRPLMEAARGVDLSRPKAARDELALRFDPAGDAARRLASELRSLLDAGEIANRGELPVRYGRVAKPTIDTLGFSIDVVLMNGAGPRHRHPRGEVNYCIALDGNPTFDGEPPGWVVLPPDSSHVPTVVNGTMLIVYLLPQGEIEFAR